MEKRINLNLFSLLADASKVTNKKIENAYGGFTEQMKTVSQSDNTYSEIYRILNDTSIELVFLQTIDQYEQEKKCLKICLRLESSPIP